MLLWLLMCTLGLAKWVSNGYPSKPDVAVRIFHCYIFTVSWGLRLGRGISLEMTAICSVTSIETLSLRGSVSHDSFCNCRHELIKCDSFLGAFAKLQIAIISLVISVRLSVRPYETTRLSLDGYSWNLIFDYFSKTRRENSSLIKIWQESWVLYVKIDKYFWSYVAEFLVEWEIFATEVVRTITTHILCVSTSLKSCSLPDNVKK